MRRLVLAITLLAAAPAAAARPFDWLVGGWCEQTSRARTCEHWAPLFRGRMEGGGNVVRGGKLVESEVTIIRLTPKGAVYEASPDGAPAVPFAEVERGAQSITFENRAHDYPQRIRYWREGADLLAEIALADGTRPMRWHYRRVR